MSAIIQELGFDASQALAELRKLDAAFETFGQSLRESGKALSAFNAVGQQSTKMRAQVVANVGASTEQVERLTTSLKLLSRIAFTQTVISGLRILKSSLHDAGQQAVAFQKQVALIRTLDNSGASLDQIAKSVRGLSDEMNVSLADAGAGVFNSISNQIGDLKESVDFSKEAAQFAKATGSTMADSVDLLSGVLKSYNLSVEDTDKVSTALFKTIDLGRVNSDQLANSFGRIGPTAAELGVSLDELGAAIAAISVKGSNTPETLTQVRAIMSALLKPSDALSKRLTELGFDSGQTAVKTLTLAGTLRELEKVTGGSAAEFARLFPNVRAMSGGFSLLSSQGKPFADAIDEMTRASRDFSKSRFLLATATDAERVTSEINKLKNALTTDLGQALLKSGVDAANFVGGAENVVTVLRDSVPAAAGLVAAFASMRASTVLANAGLATMARLLGPAGIIAAAAGAAVALRNLFQDAATQQALETLRQSEKHQNKVLDSFDANKKRELDAARASDEAQAQSIRERVREANKLYQQDLANAKTVAQKKAALESFQGRIGFPATGQEDALRRIDAGLKNADAARLQAIAAQRKDAQGTSLRSDISAIFQGINSGEALRNKLLEGAAGGQGAKAGFQELLNLAKQISSQELVSPDDLQRLEEFRNKLAESKGDFQVRSAIGRELPAFDALIQKLQQLHPEAQISPAVDAAKSLRAELEASAKAAANIQIPRPEAAIERARGGLAYLAQGGRGLDRIPAMLSPGEFVVNARSSRQFATQLTAMNAGVQPVFHQQGGGVINDHSTSVGDITINGLSKMTGREIVESIRREIRTQRVRPF